MAAHMDNSKHLALRSASLEATGVCQPKVFVVFGPPASGKGTQCKRIAAKSGLVHIPVGDIYRDAMRRGTSLGQEAKVYIDRGDFVPDAMVSSMVFERMAEPDVQARGCLLDGYPRTAEQAAALAAHVEVQRVLLLRIPEEVSVMRAANRRQDPVTGDIYNLISFPPPSDISERLVARENDLHESILRRRLQVYKDQLDGIVEHFDRSAIIDIDGDRGIDLVEDACLQGLDTEYVVEVDGDDDWPAEVVVDEALSEQATLEVALEVDLPSGECAERTVIVSVHPPSHPEGLCAPTDICCLVDTSGSMCSIASYEVDGVEKNDGLTLLDITKHAVKTVIHQLQDSDRFALVTFDSSARVAFPLGAMSEEGKSRALSALEALKPGGTTNLWSGLNTALEAMRTAMPASEARHKTIMVLTDGQPSDNKHLPQLQQYKESHPDFKFQMNTFGFGYSLNSELLHELAVHSNGTFAFVPDALILGTCFVNSASNVMSTFVQSSTVHLSAVNGAEFIGPVLGGHHTVEASWGKVVDLGPLHYGQQRNLAVRMQIPDQSQLPYLEAHLVYNRSDGTEHRVPFSCCCRESTLDSGLILSTLRTVDDANSCLADMKAGRINEVQQKLAALREDVEHREETDFRISGLKCDVVGRLTKAFDGKERFNRWGEHYTRALLRAHQVQMCTNFMDAGLQSYGGQRFQELRESGDKIFVALPLPTPSTPTRPASPPSPSNYYGGSGGG